VDREERLLIRLSTASDSYRACPRRMVSPGRFVSPKVRRGLARRATLYGGRGSLKRARDGAIPHEM